MADTNPKPITQGELSEATQDLQMLGSMLRGFLALSAKTEQLSRLIGAEREMQDRVDSLRREAEPVKELIASADAAQRRLDGINAEIASHHAKARDDRDEVIEAARVEAENIRKEGRAQADRHLSDARAAAAAEAATHAVEARRRQETIDGLDAEIAARNADIGRRQAELDRINAEIAALRAKLGVE
jgi:peptidoglycan hydrolase CwlO-like protein